MALAYAQTTMVDEAVGTILDTLDETGLADDTLVIWTNDHGDALGAHGGHADKECYMIEEILDIQLAVRDPSRPDLAGTKNTALVNTNDVPVTMLDAMGLSFDYEVPGMSLLDLMYGEVEPRQYMVCTTNGHFSDTRARTAAISRQRNAGGVVQRYARRKIHLRRQRRNCGHYNRKMLA